MSAGLHSAAPIEQDACAQANADRLRRHRPRLTVARLNGPGCDVEVIVLGGGFAGLATARGLQERGIASVSPPEAQTLDHAASCRHGGFFFGGDLRPRRPACGVMA